MLNALDAQISSVNSILLALVQSLLYRSMIAYITILGIVLNLLFRLLLLSNGLSLSNRLMISKGFSRLTLPSHLFQTPLALAPS